MSVSDGVAVGMILIVLRTLGGMVGIGFLSGSG
ncbi:hypothetical protein A2U01_0089083 [Trifolium medium]|uniref:Uncharacterized protein n=1 Tax=Trifolium medium TaxID=97028 RepID=A0A392U517_9FABA|nr:hypothetical protein [Trifolium medium]